MTMERPRRSGFELEIPAHLEDYSDKASVQTRDRLTPGEVRALRAVLALVIIILALVPFAGLDVPFTRGFLAIVAVLAILLELTLWARLLVLGIPARLFSPMRSPHLGRRHDELILATRIAAGLTLASLVPLVDTSVGLALAALVLAYPTLFEVPGHRLPLRRVLLIAGCMWLAFEVVAVILWT